MTVKRYDYIIAGAGAAGLSLAIHLIKSGKFSDKQILLVDQSPKTKNDRTWCFWESTPGLFEPVVYKSWKKLWFHSQGYSALKEIAPYTYKLIRGIDFYNYCLHLIKAQKNFTIEYGEVNSCFSNEQETGIFFNSEKILAEYIFSSIIFDKPVHSKGYSYLLQHFKGCFIATDQPVFNTNEATLMDFRVHQKHGTTFVYVMPFSSTEALVEYTLFSENLLSPQEYDEGISNYCRDQLKLGDDYSVITEEFGVIPMTDHPFKQRDHNIMYIGTAGGQTKASSGYTFQFIQKNCKQIVKSLVSNGTPFVKKPFASKRFAWFDSILLKVIATNKYPGDKIFSLFMKKNPIAKIFKFLDNETSPAEEISIIKPLPTLIFSKAAIQSLMRKPLR